MKTKSLLTVCLSLLLAFGVFGCAKPNEATEATAAPDATAPVDVGSFDRDAIAVELGSVKITAGEIADSYSYYMSMLESYYGSAPTDDASIKEYRDLAIDDLIRYHIPEWKAAELGVSLTAEDEAEIEAATAEEIDEMRNSLILDYAYYYAGVEDAESVDELTEEQKDLALNQIASELTEYFYEGYTLEQYLSEQYEMLLNDKRMEKQRDALKETSVGSNEVTDAQIDEWYQSALSAQQTDFDENPIHYREQVEDYASGAEEVPALYLPEGFIRVQIIRFAPESERDLAIDANRAEMATLEAEYGALALNDANAERQAEIQKRYAELKAENERLEEAYLGEARKKINKAYEALEEETPFEDVLAQYGQTTASNELLLYVGDEDPDYGELADVANGLLQDTYSEPLLIDDAYYIVKRLADPTPGAIDRAAIAEQVRAAATAALVGEAWDALYAEWETEAETAAVRHEEAYAAVGYLNQ